MNINFPLFVYLFFIWLSPYWQILAQDPTRFQDEIDDFIAEDHKAFPSSHQILFTGSSSIRLWENLNDFFPNHNIIQRGFGGSHFSDLIYYADTLIFRYQPSKIFIYEGDNDLYAGMSVRKVMHQAKKLVRMIRQELPENTEIYFISPKPSIARQTHAELYKIYNQKLKDFCAHQDDIYFVNVWDVLLDDSGKPDPELFIDDGLHLNEKGYRLWQEIIGPYLNQ